MRAGTDTPPGTRVTPRNESRSLTILHVATAHVGATTPTAGSGGNGGTTPTCAVGAFASHRPATRCAALACLPGAFSLPGCAFSGTPKLLAWAKVEGTSVIRERCGQKNGETPWQRRGRAYACSPRLLARTLLRHCPGMDPFSPTTSRGSNDGQHSQPVLAEWGQNLQRLFWLYQFPILLCKNISHAIFGLTGAREVPIMLHTVPIIVT